MKDIKVGKLKSRSEFVRVVLFVALALTTVSLCSSLLSACSGEDEQLLVDEDEQIVVAEYRKISASVARQMMDDYPDVLILDVRTNEEFGTGHIPGAVLKPYDEVAQWIDKAPPPKDQTILIYCRSGRRSALAAQDFIDRGYTQVFDFGGITDWPYEIE